MLQKFERFFEKIPHDSSIAFVVDEVNALRITNYGLCTFVTYFVKALERLHSVMIDHTPKAGISTPI